MIGQSFCEALRNGKRLYGTLLVSSAPEWPAQVSRLGLDFVFFDTEHISPNRKTLSALCRTYAAMDLNPIVRIASSDPNLAAMALDGGAGGIIAPYVERAGQVQTLRGAVKLGPIKGQKLAAILDGKPGVLEPELAAYLDKRNRGKALIVMIESRPAIEALDDILAIPQLDAVLIGPHDLSCSLGIPEQYDHQDLDRAVRTIIEKARASGVGAGMHFLGDMRRQEIDWIRAGANLIIHSADIIAFTKTIQTEISHLKQVVGDFELPRASSEINI
jgi:2-keto-3-deoxy-L-rhamnonate aldolase RhmA